MAIGQHFLVNRSVVAKILEAADLHEDDQVLEIGPGRGAITLEMAKRVRLVKAVELDHELAIRLPKLDNLQVIEGDFLQVDLEELLGKAPCLDDQRLCCSKALLNGRYLRLKALKGRAMQRKVRPLARLSRGRW